MLSSKNDCNFIYYTIQLILAVTVTIPVLYTKFTIYAIILNFSTTPLCIYTTPAVNFKLQEMYSTSNNRVTIDLYIDPFTLNFFTTPKEIAYYHEYRMNAYNISKGTKYSKTNIVNQLFSISKQKSVKQHMKPHVVPRGKCVFRNTVSRVSIYEIHGYNQHDYSYCINLFLLGKFSIGNKMTGNDITSYTFYCFFIDESVLNTESFSNTPLNEAVNDISIEDSYRDIKSKDSVSINSLSEPCALSLDIVLKNCNTELPYRHIPIFIGFYFNPSE